MQELERVVCDCGKNPTGEFWVYRLNERFIAVVCPYCGDINSRWEAAGAEPVEGSEGGSPEGLQAGVHEGVHAPQARRVGRPRKYPEGFDRVGYQREYMRGWRARRKAK